jgi:DNA repair protein RadC
VKARARVLRTALAAMPLEDRPREKLLRAGAPSLNDTELVALVLGTGVHGRDALAVAVDLLTACGGVEGPAAAASYLLPRLGRLREEHFGVLLLDTRHRLIRAVVVSIGSLDASLVHPREVFRTATEHSAAAMVLFHNHPSGDPAPSAEDLVLTRRLVQAGELMGIGVVDHVVLGDGCWHSVRESSPALFAR